MDIESIIILAFCPVLLPFYIFAILMMFGIGGKLLSGFNISKSETTAKEEFMFIARRAGIGVFIVLAMLHTIIVLMVLKLYIWGGVMIGVAVAFVIAFLLYMNNKKMKEKLQIVIDGMENQNNQKAENYESNTNGETNQLVFGQFNNINQFGLREDISKGHIVNNFELISIFEGKNQKIAQAKSHWQQAYFQIERHKNSKAYFKNQ